MQKAQRNETEDGNIARSKSKKEYKNIFSKAVSFHWLLFLVSPAFQESEIIWRCTTELAIYCNSYGEYHSDVTKVGCYVAFPALMCSYAEM